MVRRPAAPPTARALASAICALSIATLPACESSGPKAGTGNAEVLSVRLTNQTDLPVRVLVSLGSREPATASEVWAINGPTITLAPKEASTYTLFATDASTRPSDDVYDRVIRVRLETIRPSWAPNEVFWYELANPEVKQILIQRFELGGLTVRSPQSRVAVMPRERQAEFGLE
jgi:hypothetical protein